MQTSDLASSAARRGAKSLAVKNPSKTPDSESKSQYIALLAALILGLVTGLLAISRTTFWIDEGGTGLLAQQATFQGWWSTLLWEKNSNMQLPLYLVTLWAWARTLGTGEWTLRMLNLPFFIASLTATWLAFREERQRFIFAVLFLCSNAFVWFYLDQARPYLVLLAGSTFLFGAVYQFWTKRDCTTTWVWWFTAACLVVAATSIIGLEWAIISILSVWYFGGRQLPITFARNFAGALTLLLVGLVSIACYYAWSLQIGADVPKYGRMGLLTNVAFAVYELFGFTGFGPNRNWLRTEPAAALIPFALPLACFAVLLLALCIYGEVWKTTFQRGNSLLLYIFLILPAPIVVIAGEYRNVRVLPRHLTPLMPIIMLLMSGLLARCWNRSSVGRGLVCVFLSAALISSLEVRFSARLKRDDYRQAALLARREMTAGRWVLWTADPQTAMYYGLLEKKDWEPGGAGALFLPWRDYSSAPRDRGTVLYSKPDLYDANGTVHSFLIRNRFKAIKHFEAFDLWQPAR